MNFDPNFYNIFSELQYNSDNNTIIYDGLNQIQTFTNLQENKNSYISNFLISNQSKIELTQTVNNSYNDNSSTKIFINIDNEQNNQSNNQIYLENNDIKNNKKLFTISTKPLLGRKKKFEKNKGKHNKFSDDNLRKKVKHLVIRSVMNYINKKIESSYNDKINNKIIQIKFLTLNKKQKSNSDVDYNKDFLNKKIGDILSDKISKKYTNHKEDHNKTLVNYLSNEKDIYKYIFFNNIFNLTFLQCLKHYNGEKPIMELKGAKSFIEDKNTLEEDDNYISVLENYIKNYEEIILNKNARKKRLPIKNNKN